MAPFSCHFFSLFQVQIHCKTKYCVPNSKSVILLIVQRFCTRFRYMFRGQTEISKWFFRNHARINKIKILLRILKSRGIPKQDLTKLSPCIEMWFKHIYEINQLNGRHIWNSIRRTSNDISTILSRQVEKCFGVFVVKFFTEMAKMQW